MNEIGLLSDQLTNLISEVQSNISQLRAEIATNLSDEEINNTYKLWRRNLASHSLS